MANNDSKTIHDIEIEEGLIEFLFNHIESHIKDKNKLKDLKGKYNSKDLFKFLIRRSSDPIIRNLINPTGENYAPIYYDRDCILKLIIKRWGIIPTLTLWDLLIIDFDEKISIPELKSFIMKSPYHDQLFYIHKTTKGYHLYLMSKFVRYCSQEAINIRLALNCDLIYGTFSLYTGPSIRLAKKGGDQDLPSVKVGEVGSGVLDKEVEKVYQKCIDFLELFQNENGKSFSESGMDKLWNLWEETVNNNDDFGLVHIAVTAPMMLHKTKEGIKINQLIDKSKCDSIWEEFLSNPEIIWDNLPILLKESKKLKQYSNLYRIFKATDDYAIGAHIQESLHFISFRDLLVVDYDNCDQLDKIYEYNKLYPKTVFRVVKTHRGYHVFLTSHSIDHDSLEAIGILLQLNSDPCHILSCYHRGFSVRINRKYDDESEYKEIAIIGNDSEVDRLVNLYHLHLRLYQQNKYTEKYMCMKDNALKSLGEQIFNKN